MNWIFLTGSPAGGKYIAPDSLEKADLETDLGEYSLFTALVYVIASPDPTSYLHIALWTTVQ